MSSLTKRLWGVVLFSLKWPHLFPTWIVIYYPSKSCEYFYLFVLFFLITKWWESLHADKSQSIADENDVWVHLNRVEWNVNGILSSHHGVTFPWLMTLEISHRATSMPSVEQIEKVTPEVVDDQSLTSVTKWKVKMLMVMQPSYFKGSIKFP